MFFKEEEEEEEALEKTKFTQQGQTSQNVEIDNQYFWIIRKHKAPGVDLILSQLTQEGEGKLYEQRHKTILNMEE